MMNLSDEELKIYSNELRYSKCVTSMARELLQMREQRNQLLRDMGDMAESLEMVLSMREKV